ncbi:MAG: AlwI family type II restriction endonuclease [Desulfobacteraceae bacterium]|nr:AlwI family type II restriction endonuclease [Desulfobacteraceae bacterium]
MKIDRCVSYKCVKIDQDFLPVAPAPGRGPDLIFEFKDYVLVIEVTLTSSSRQEAAEGEPVRRHVAEIAEQYDETDKRVYGLFMALNVDSNTAETFKGGNWYKQDDSKLTLHIIPIRLDDFSKLFEAGFKSGMLTPNKIRELITECRALSNYDAPEWKNQITKEIKRLAERMVKANDL